MALLINRGIDMKTLILFITFMAMNMQVQAQAQEIAISQEVRMLALGDSYTIGERVKTERRWPHQFVAALRTKGIKAVDPDYIAVSGWTTSDLLKGLKNDLDRKKSYKLVSILIGVNNQYQGMDIRIYEPELRQIMDQALELVEHDTSSVFMISIPDYAFTPFGKGDKVISREIDAYNEINKRVAADYGIVRIDITPISRRGLIEPGLVAGDGLHPSGEQYREWVEKIISKMESSVTKPLDSR
jgi:acyl-CoA thioesterase-1